MRCPQMFWDRTPGSWTGVGKAAFSVGWQFIASNRASNVLQREGDDVLQLQKMGLHTAQVKYSGARPCRHL